MDTRRLREAVTAPTVREIPVAHLPEIAKLSYRHRHRDERYAPAQVEGAPPEVVERWTVNYLRHNCTDYDTVIEHLTPAQADEYRDRLYDAIAEAYPHLAAECERQKRYKRKEHQP